MADCLTTYLEDHLAGAALAIDILRTMKERRDDRLSRFADSLLAKIEEDEQTLRTIAKRLGSASNFVKEAGAWLAEKASKAKLSIHASGDLGNFEALEFLALGIQGKLSLWRALQVIAASDNRLSNLDLDRLIARGEEQYKSVEQQRLSLAISALLSE